METETTDLEIKDSLINLIYKVCRNHFKYPEAGIIAILDIAEIRNRDDLRQMNFEQLKELAREVITLFKEKTLNRPSAFDKYHEAEYFRPLEIFIQKLD